LLAELLKPLLIFFFSAREAELEELRRGVGVSGLRTTGRLGPRVDKRSESLL
jgi:hypothetical protein